MSSTSPTELLHDVIELHVIEIRQAGCEGASNYAFIGEISVCSNQDSIFHTMFFQLLINRAMADQMSDLQTKLLPALAKRTSSSTVSSTASSTASTDEEEETMDKKKKGKKYSHYDGEEGLMDDEIDDREGEKEMLYDPDLL